MKFFITVAAFTALGFAVASNATTQFPSEFFYQVEVDKQSVKSGFAYNARTVHYKQTKTEVEQGLGTLGISYGYGVHDFVSLLASTGYTFGSVKVDGNSGNSVQGLEDLNFSAKGSYSVIENGSVWYSANLSISPVEKEVNNKDQEENAFSGGNAFEPEVGFVWALEPMGGFFGQSLAGVKVGHKLNLGDKTKKTTDSGGTETEAKTSGGEKTTLAASFETKFVIASLSQEPSAGVQVAYKSFSEEKNKGGSTISNKYSNVGLDLYAKYPYSEEIDLMADLNVSLHSDNDMVNNDDSSDFTVGVAARCKF